MVREGTPEALTGVFALVTELGSVAFLVVLLSVLYWVDDRESTGTVVGYTFVALALVLTLKETLALARPPPSVRAVAVEPGSHGFPSGHAIAATVVYGGLLVARDKLRDPRYAVPGVALIVLIGLSRVVIGVHYVGDVLVGHAIGVVVLGGLWVTLDHRPDMACLLAAGISLIGIVVTGASSYALLGFGGSLGGAYAFWAVESGSLPEATGVAQAIGLVVVGLLFAGGAFGLARLAPLAPLAVLANAVLVAGIIVLPKALDSPVLAPLADG